MTKQGLGELYDAYFKTRFGFDPRRDLVWREVVAWIQRRYVPEDSRVIDLGAGYCNFINNIKGREKRAVDVFSRFPEYANPDVKVHIASATEMPFLQDDSFDVAFASNLFEHVSRPELILILGELRRILRKDGRLIMMQPNFRYCFDTYFDDYTHQQIFTDASMCDFLEAYGFTVIGNHPRFMPVNMKSTLRLDIPFLALLVRAYLASPFKPFGGQFLIAASNQKKGPGEV